ncbi:3-hydroxyisobutyrate dehydrogenase (plasmid) [Legionella adelaidensis]|uniref:3-hydroxyisobutyrate dehydrogenase n=1 Tax=Legionella adelaidensis TaxID=45056 RepID=A0A0W0R0Q7_9GAMM|nr:3-hydroxyisobutyrate dehydrogenase [Legionella adelaidensis]KTC64673.1 3-hydroxyisobutyrate dehydrogenase [Legionella adelaidensis]VEH86141.1 3-hydroxyisobutyrate dehydrogenase [Legionella adelaidensis]
MASIGFVGLGHMGLPMATNLIKAGHTVTGFDLQPQALGDFVSAGGIAASSLEELGANQTVLITMLQTGDQVKKVCLGEQGLFQYAKPQTLYIDCSSIDVDASREVHKAATNAHLFVVDAPVSGGVAGAAAATLTFMVGGQEKAFAEAKPILSCMGKNIIHTGEAGSGQAAKICNNMILGVTMIAVSEAFILAEQLGLSAKKLHEVVTNSSGNCWVMNKYVPVANILENVPANNQYEPGFTVAMMLKDLNLSQNCAKNVGVSTELGKHATAIYSDFHEKGYENKDFSAIIESIKINN